MEYFANAWYACTNMVPTDVYPFQYGEEQCRPGHFFGPCVRNNYLLHYIYSGHGIFRCAGQEYALSAGDLFLIVPGELTYYKADTEEPWLYRWIEFNGSLIPAILKSGDIPDKSGVLTENTEIGRVILDMVQNQDMEYERLMQKLWGLLFAMTKGKRVPNLSPAENYIRKAEGYIKANLHKKITVSDVAAHVGIDRSYLSRLFGEYKGMAPQQFILLLKLNTAAQYLKNTSITVAEAAQSVGYTDVHIFYKAFRQRFGTTPTEWRRQKDWEQSVSPII